MVDYYEIQKTKLINDKDITTMIIQKNEITAESS